MEERVDVTIPMEREFVDEIEDQLTYGDSRSAWIREAIRMRLDDQIALEVGMSDEMRTQINAAVQMSGKSQREFIMEAIIEELENSSD